MEAWDLLMSPKSLVLFYLLFVFSMVLLYFWLSHFVFLFLFVFSMVLLWFRLRHLCAKAILDCIFCNLVVRSPSSQLCKTMQQPACQRKSCMTENKNCSLIFILVMQLPGKRRGLWVYIYIFISFMTYIAETPAHLILLAILLRDGHKCEHSYDLQEPPFLEETRCFAAATYTDSQAMRTKGNAHNDHIVHIAPLYLTFCHLSSSHQGNERETSPSIQAALCRSLCTPWDTSKRDKREPIVVAVVPTWMTALAANCNLRLALS